MALHFWFPCQWHQFLLHHVNKFKQLHCNPGPGSVAVTERIHHVAHYICSTSVPLKPKRFWSIHWRTFVNSSTTCNYSPASFCVFQILQTSDHLGCYCGFSLPSDLHLSPLSANKFDEAIANLDGWSFGHKSFLKENATSEEATSHSLHTSLFKH